MATAPAKSAAKGLLELAAPVNSGGEGVTLVASGVSGVEAGGGGT